MASSQGILRLALLCGRKESFRARSVMKFGEMFSLPARLFNKWQQRPHNNLSIKITFYCRKYNWLHSLDFALFMLLLRRAFFELLHMS